VSVGGLNLTAQKLVAALATLVALGAPAPGRAAVDRPPQFIVMAFDNCTELERWQELTDFAAELNKDGERVHLTFFVSGSNFIADSSRNIYAGPHQRRGYSRISFGGTPEQIRKRVEYVNALYRSGHEIASHAVGHFNGASWSAVDWEKEFRAFGQILKNVGPNNELPGSQFAFPVTDVIGFRAPLSRQRRSTIQRAQGARLPLRHQRGRPSRRLAGKDRWTVAIQLGHVEDPRFRQGHAVDGL